MNDFEFDLASLPQDIPPSATVRCHHRKPGGERCGSPALRGSNLCYYHNETRGTPEQIAIRKARHRSIMLPGNRLRTRADIQARLDAVTQAIAGNQIDLRRAGLLLYGLQIASSNISEHQRNHFKALPKTMEYLCEPREFENAEYLEHMRNSGDHYGTGRRPQATPEGEPISTAPNYVSAERVAHDQAIPDFTPRPAQWKKISNSTGSMLLEELGRHHSRNQPLTGSPADRKPSEDDVPQCSLSATPWQAGEPEHIVIAAMQATSIPRTRALSTSHLASGEATPPTNLSSRPERSAVERPASRPRTPPNHPTTPSSRPERSAVERPAFRPRTPPNHPHHTVISTGAKRSGETCFSITNSPHHPTLLSSL
ncbi:MAG: hypothetical protein PW789_12410 [Edaphobacter sp.]|uniref:hypothetical protein n=1 Tax=Edaphobacter sp. TaxID=1934404 RepID=UPI00239B848B|nr:hypothetical protein [Edaphobacter sp.]MDE1177386.1 hypothetical protein [Edaphobacter sp.]